jgi:octaprenyl-diphosphate synthase
MESPVAMSDAEHAPWSEIASFRPIDAPLRQVRDQIRRSLTTESVAEELRPLFDHLNLRSGKMLRPGLLLLTGRCFGPPNDEHIRIAAIMEMIHHATLLHDDVIDDGRKRRGVPTVNSLWGNESAVLLGDFVLSRVFTMAADIEPSTARIIAETAVRVCHGELRQVVQKRNWELPEDQYIEVITEKSASFFASCCRLGATLSQARPEQAEATSRFGLNAGIAFQIMDDLLDIAGDESRMGKTAQSDFAQDKPTLALIHLLRTANASDRADALAALNGRTESRRRLVAMLADHGSVQYARRQAGEYVAKAIDQLSAFPANDTREKLRETAHFMADRTV